MMNQTHEQAIEGKITQHTHFGCNAVTPHTTSKHSCECSKV